MRKGDKLHIPLILEIKENLEELVLSISKYVLKQLSTRKIYEVIKKVRQIYDIQNLLEADPKSHEISIKFSQKFIVDNLKQSLQTLSQILNIPKSRKCIDSVSTNFSIISNVETASDVAKQTKTSSSLDQSLLFPILSIYKKNYLIQTEQKIINSQLHDLINSMMSIYAESFYWENGGLVYFQRLWGIDAWTKKLKKDESVMTSKCIESTENDELMNSWLEHEQSPEISGVNQDFEIYEQIRQMWDQLEAFEGEHKDAHLEEIRINMEFLSFYKKRLVLSFALLEIWPSQDHQKYEMNSDFALFRDFFNQKQAQFEESDHVVFDMHRDNRSGLQSLMEEKSCSSESDSALNTSSLFLNMKNEENQFILLLEKKKDIWKQNDQMLFFVHFQVYLEMEDSIKSKILLFNCSIDPVKLVFHFKSADNKKSKKRSSNESNTPKVESKYIFELDLLDITQLKMLENESCKIKVTREKRLQLLKDCSRFFRSSDSLENFDKVPGLELEIFLESQNDSCRDMLFIIERVFFKSFDS